MIRLQFNLQRTLFACLLVVSSACTHVCPAGREARARFPSATAQTILADDLLRDAAILASDEFEGRKTGSPGQLRAAEFIARRFEALGLEPIGDAPGWRGYLQEYPVERTWIGEGANLEIGPTKLANGFALFRNRSGNIEFDAPIEWCGSGHERASSEERRPHVAIAMVEPPSGDVPTGLSLSQQFGLSFNVIRGLTRRAQRLAGDGAVAVVFLQREDKIGLTDVLSYTALASGTAAVREALPAGGWGGAADPRGQLVQNLDVPTFVLTVDASRAVMRGLGPGGGAGKTARCRLQVEQDPHAPAWNVAGVLRGRDASLTRQAIVYSAHMDHVGRRMDGEVYNGADDNASGVAGLLALAKAYAEGPLTERSVVLLSASGEEHGLLGSRHFVANCSWPIADVVGAINLDMVGRSGSKCAAGEIAVTPSPEHPSYSTLAAEADRVAELVEVRLVGGDDNFAQSDHVSFSERGIPVVSFGDGGHLDYHQVTDDVARLDGDKLQRVARLAYWVGWRAARADAAPALLQSKVDAR